MKLLNTIVSDSSWMDFVETLNDEFTARSGKGMYAHITPHDVMQLYQQYQDRQMHVRNFARQCVRAYA